MIKFIFYCLLAYLVYRVISSFQKVKTPPSPPPPAAPSGTMVKDEVCQTYIPREKALREMIDGEERFFCSPDCRRKGLEERKRNR